MALDIRLDFIKNIKQEQLDQMTALRKRLIEIDDTLKDIADELHLKDSPAGLRTIALSRTHLEIACQFAIKSLCILGETE